ncbi:hypothetical protein R1flu_009992 [Riccia fluitans]|uniref:Uncharacterized protein n=1 Tax=Riccia fluitans TaxID=41844 RepID=A0ABD1Z3Q6_9MARC
MGEKISPNTAQQTEFSSLCPDRLDSTADHEGAAEAAVEPSTIAGKSGCQEICIKRQQEEGVLLGQKWRLPQLQAREGTADGSPKRTSIMALLYGCPFPAEVTHPVCQLAMPTGRVHQ